VAACGQDTIAIGQGTPESDYHRGELVAAIDRFVTAGRTARAFGALVSEVEALRPGMDETVAREAERRLLVLALDPTEAFAGVSIDEQAAGLATTVWSFALRPPLDDDPPTGDLAVRAAELAVRQGEDPRSYLVRLCGWALAATCRHAVPEMQGALVRAAAVARMTERVRNAVQACLPCENDPAWHKAVKRWEALDDAASESAREDARRAAPARWPTAGRGSVDWPGGAPLLVIEEDGDAVLGSPLTPSNRIDALRRVRRGPALSVHIAPGARADQLAGILADAAAAGYREVLVQAREEAYPWQLRAYRFSVEPTRGRAAPWRPQDTVQVLLRGVDAVGPEQPAHL